MHEFHPSRQSRRRFLQASGAGITGTMLPEFLTSTASNAQEAQQTGTVQLSSDSAAGVKVLLPQCRVPLSFIIDDSTCLVNMGHFCTPQFAEAWPERKQYQRPWRQWPREIPDRFVRQFGQWCSEHGVKGKYSIVPYPACVGWLDRELPGWSRSELRASIDLVRDLMLPNWDIHPEMITHTRVIDLDTGRPIEPVNSSTMENSYPQEKKSVDELAAYLSYALRILKNCGLPCEGVTTPGGFGNAVKQELPQAVDEAVRDVFGSDLPHYFKYVRMGEESVEPVAEFVRNEDTADPRVVMNVPAGTGDWFGGWQGVLDSEPDRYLTEDGTKGRMAELIQQRKPAVMLCHWPGMYCNGSLTGFNAFQRIVETLAETYGDETIWMKVSEIGRYWAAKRFTRFERQDERLDIFAPFSVSALTLQVNSVRGPLSIDTREAKHPLQEVSQRSQLKSNTWLREGDHAVVCVDLPKGESELHFQRLQS